MAFSDFAGSFQGRHSSERRSTKQTEPGSGRHHNFDPNQPRVPRGRPDGGQWTSGSGHSDLPIDSDSARQWIDIFHGARGAEKMRTAAAAPSIARPVPTPVPPIFIPGTSEHKQWKDQAIKGLRGLYDETIRLLREFKSKEDCEKQAESDEAICASLRKSEVRNRCYASANARYGACTSGKSLPPLITW
jgi:hypothetical protein